MNVKLTVLAIGSALAIAGCSTTTTNTNANANRAGANSNTAVVMNANNAPITGTNTSGNANTSASSNFNYNMSREEANTSRTSIEAEAKKAGGSIGQGASDSWIWLKTRGALMATSGLHDSTINVDVNDGVITLKGEVTSQAQVAEADKVAKGIEGKKSVVNQLKVNPNASVLNTNTSGGNANHSNANAATKH